MANYTKLVNYIVKDALPSGNTAKIIRGTELDNEFSAISSAISSKLDSSGGSLLNGSLSGTTSIGGTLNVSANTTITGVLSTATFSSSNATITGGSVNSTPVGNVTPSTGAFTNLSYSGSLTGGTGVINIGSGQVYKDASGNVGIGTSSPAFKLDVTGGSVRISDNNGLRIVGTTSVDFAVNASGLNIDAFTAGAGILLKTQSVTKAALTSGGNLLVGGTADSGLRGFFTGDSTSATVRDRNNTAGSAKFQLQNPGDEVFDFRFDPNSNLIFEQDGVAERARITPAGYFKVSNTGSYGGVAGVGDQSASALHLFQSDQNSAIVRSLTGNTGGSVVCYQSLLPNGSAGFHFIGSLNGGEVYRVLANGNVQNTNNSYGAISDAKLKENVTDATPKLEALNQLRVVNYNLIGSDLKQIGLIAQEVEEIFPGLVESTPDTVEVTKTRTVEIPAVLDEEGNEVTPATTTEETYTEREPNGEVTKAVKYSVLVPMLLKAVQELSAEIEALKAKLP